jgi:hypothetical protein
MHAKGVIYGVARLVPHNAQAFRLGAALDFEHLPAFELYQSGMGKIKGDGKT